ncbi:MAG TPA: 4-oxalocrotonate decarboxylase [Natronosporangium sp.]|nr:4-oxalocrotonate decarboxylase [Natronosporangium sp.]
MNGPPVPVPELAARLDEAAASATPVDRLTATVSLDLTTAYRVQRELVDRRVRRGERIVGLKLGLTSRAKMAQMGVDQMVWGWLTDAMRVPDGGSVDCGRLIHPRVEPEVAFLLTGRTGEFPDAVSAVAPALEVIDSRYTGFRFTLPDVIADNTSAAGFVVGPWRPVPSGVDNLGVLLEVDGRAVRVGSTAAILADPRRAVEQALALAAAEGVAPQPGWVLLAGAATEAVPLTPGCRVRAVVEELGGASLTARGGEVTAP